MPGIGRGRGVITVGRCLLTNIAFRCFSGALLVSQGHLLSVNALVLQVGLPRQSEGGLGHQCPHSRPCHLGHLVRNWEVGGGGSAVLSSVVVFQVIGCEGEVSSSLAEFLMQFPASVALE